MKRIFTYTMFLVSVIQIKTFEASAQAIRDSQILNSSLYQEKLYMFTDRSLYAAGETVHFRLFNLSHPLLKNSNWSMVIYLELINSRDMAVARGKYAVNSGGGYGEIIIPDTTSTGHYYLRAYTSWMRNYPPSEYFHLPLAIVNPRKIRSTDLSPGVTGTGLSEEAPGPVAGIVCTADNTSYGKREKVTVQINPESRWYSPDGYCISVIKKGYLDESFYYNTEPSGEDQLQLKDLVFYPETRGATVSGTVLLGEEKEPAKKLLMGLTMLGSDPDYLEFMTDENGRFRIPVPRQTGNTDALVTFSSKVDEPVEILMDKAFSPDISTEPVPAVDFFGERTELVEDAMVNSQLRAAFESVVNDSVDAKEPNSDYLFYGTPEFRYRTEDYVTLPDLGEFLFEIVPQVRVEKYKDHTRLIVLDDRGEILDPPPLILLDYVPVPEIGNILSASPLRIDHIDIVNKIYFRGDNTYGGIVSIITGQGDRAGVALPEGSTFIRFTGLNDLHETDFPDYATGIRNERIPDLRNTLYWDAQYDIPRGNGGNFTFYTSDVTGEFMVIVRGITSAGNVLSGSCEFTVKTQSP